MIPFENLPFFKLEDLCDRCDVLFDENDGNHCMLLYEREGLTKIFLRGGVV